MGFAISDTDGLWAALKRLNSGVSITGLDITTAAGQQTNQIIIPRHRYLLPALREAVYRQSNAFVPIGAGLGNSNIRGDGASVTATFAWLYVLGANMATWGGFAGSRWTATNYGIGGANIATPAMFLADAAPTTYYYPTRSVVSATDATYYLIEAVRNSEKYPLDQYAMLLRATLRTCHKQRTDPIVIIDQPTITYATGVITDTQATFGDFADATRQICADEGASVVDVNKYFTMLAAQGVSLIPYYATDGIHLGDAGHAIVATLVQNCMLTPPVSQPQLYKNRPVTDGKPCFITNYTSASGTATLTTSGTGTMTAAIVTTSRKVQLAEGTSQGYVFTVSQTANFVAPAPATGVIVSIYTELATGGNANTGSVYLAYAGALIQSGSLVFDGGNPAQSTVAGRQFDVYVKFDNLAAASNQQMGNLLVSATGGKVTILGVAFVCPHVTEYHAAYTLATETGTVGWSDSTIAGGEACRTSATADALGDAVATITWFGTDLGILFESAPNAGQVKFSNDGAADSAALELYTAAAAAVFRTAVVAKNLSRGWHTTAIKVQSTKHASSTGYRVAWGHPVVGDRCPDPDTALIFLAQSETMNLPSRWAAARIYEVLSGSPTLRFTPNATTIALGGTGGAIVELRR